MSYGGMTTTTNNGLQLLAAPDGYDDEGLVTRFFIGVGQVVL
jgi:hypothetical protein